jgi:hypothetical protein
MKNKKLLDKLRNTALKNKLKHEYLDRQTNRINELDNEN